MLVLINNLIPSQKATLALANATLLEMRALRGLFA